MYLSFSCVADLVRAALPSNTGAYRPRVSVWASSALTDARARVCCRLLPGQAAEESQALPHDALGVTILGRWPDERSDAGNERAWMDWARMVMARQPHDVRRDNVRRHFA
jgi:hypothetical protein